MFSTNVKVTDLKTTTQTNQLTNQNPNKSRTQIK